MYAHPFFFFTVGEGVVWARAYGVSRHLPVSKGRACPGEPGSVTPLPLPSHTCLFLLHRDAPSSRLFPTWTGRRGAGVGCGVSVLVCLRLRHWAPLAFSLLTTKASARGWAVYATFLVRTSILLVRYAQLRAPRLLPEPRRAALSPPAYDRV